MDLGFFGSEYTWMDNREDEVHCRFDRVLMTQAWIQLFPYIKVCHLNPSKSNHLLTVMEIRDSVGGTTWKSRRFCFEEIWLQVVSCEDTTATACV